MTARLRVGDLVTVTAGNHKGVVGRLDGFNPAKDRVFVANVPMRKRHRKALPGEERGQIVMQPVSVHVSNVMPVDSDNKARRVRIVEGKRVLANGESVRQVEAKAPESVEASNE